MYLNWVFPFLSQIFESDMFLRIVSSYAKAQAYFRVMFVFKCLASWRLKQQVFNEGSKHLDQQLIALSRFPSGRQSGLKLQCWYGNPMANNFFQNRILHNLWIAKLKYQVEDCIHQVEWCSLTRRRSDNFYNLPYTFIRNFFRRRRIFPALSFENHLIISSLTSQPSCT